MGAGLGSALWSGGCLFESASVASLHVASGGAEAEESGSRGWLAEGPGFLGQLGVPQKSKARISGSDNGSHSP